MSGECGGGTEREIPDGWEREELIAGMDTVGSFSISDVYIGMGGGYKCNQCQHFVPLESVDDDACPLCDRCGMIATVIMGTQRVTALYPEGWFDDDDRSADTDTQRFGGSD